VTVVAALAGGSGAGLVSGWNAACWVCAASSVAGAVAVAALGPAAAPA
jgi:hypothetical protein